MASKKTVKTGIVLKQKNLERRKGANAFYYVTILQFGRKKLAAEITESELRRILVRAGANPEDISAYLERLRETK